MSLPDIIRKSGNDITLNDLNKDDGLDQLIAGVCSLYAKNINTLAYMAYDRFEHSNQEKISIADYINESERLKKSIQFLNMSFQQEYQSTNSYRKLMSR